MKNLTPQHLRCAPLHCPSVHELEDGRLLIIGARSGPELAHFVNERLGNGETAVIIDRALLAGVHADEVAALKAENERLRAVLSTPIQGVTLGSKLEGKITEQEALDLVNASRMCLLASFQQEGEGA